jgi:DNA-binding HxlR family transcriptional regulator
MTREDVKRDILRLVARYDGQWYWYEIDRALSGIRPACVGPFKEEIRALAEEGLIEIRPNPAIDQHERYWLTEQGRRVVAAMACSVRPGQDSSAFHMDQGSIALAQNPRFRAIIEESRRSYREQGGISLEDLRRELGLDEPDDSGG